MKAVLVLLVASVYVATALHHGDHEGHQHHQRGGSKRGNFLKKMTKDIPECKELYETDDEGYSIPNCSANITMCFKKVHQQARRCVGKEMRKWREAGEAPRQCYKEHKADHKDWFKLSCIWHRGVQKCMNGDEADGIYKHEATEGDDHSEADGHPQHHKDHLKAKACWEKVHQLTDGCLSDSKQENYGCANYQYCAGKTKPEESDARLSAWYETANHIKLQKHQKTVANHKAIQDCITKKNNAEEEAA